MEPHSRSTIIQNTFHGKYNIVHFLIVDALLWFYKSASNSLYICRWSFSHPQFVRNAFLVSIGICLEGVVVFHLVARFHGIPTLRKRLGLDAVPRKKDD